MHLDGALPVTERAPRTRVAPVALAVALGVVAFLAGALAGSLSIGSGLESGKGATEVGNAITWWGETAVTLTLIPSPVPATANASAATPTLLTTANTSYAVGAVKANDSAIRWDFQLKAPPVLTEFEITVTVLNLTAASAATFTVFLETPATAPTGTVLVSLFVDNGAGTTGFQAVSQLSQQCTAFGTCP